MTKTTALVLAMTASVFGLTAGAFVTAINDPLPHQVL
jgi:hypothetical protein